MEKRWYLLYKYQLKTFSDCSQKVFQRNIILPLMLLLILQQQQLLLLLLVVKIIIDWNNIKNRDKIQITYRISQYA